VRILAVLLTLASVLIVIGEASLFTDFPIGVFPLFFDDSHGIVGTQLLAYIPFFYLIVCVYIPVFSLKLPGKYGLFNKN